jgi:hypothetical protein
LSLIDLTIGSPTFAYCFLFNYFVFFGFHIVVSHSTAIAASFQHTNIYFQHTTRLYTPTLRSIVMLLSVTSSCLTLSTVHFISFYYHPLSNMSVLQLVIIMLLCVYSPTVGSRSDPRIKIITQQNNENGTKHYGFNYSWKDILLVIVAGTCVCIIAKYFWNRHQSRVRRSNPLQLQSRPTSVPPVVTSPQQLSVSQLPYIHSRPPVHHHASLSNLR